MFIAPVPIGWKHVVGGPTGPALAENTVIIPGSFPTKTSVVVKVSHLDGLLLLSFLKSASCKERSADKWSRAVAEFEVCWFYEHPVGKSNPALKKHEHLPLLWFIFQDTQLTLLCVLSPAFAHST